MSSQLILSYRACESDSRLLPSLSRATPSAVSEHFSELIGYPISRSLTTYCVRLELGSRPSTGVTRLPRVPQNLSRLPRAPGLSLAGVLGLSSPDHALGSLPCCVRFPCVHAVAPTPAAAAAGPITSLIHPSRISLPRKRLSGRPAHRPFFEACSAISLALRLVTHSRCHHQWSCTQLTEGFRPSSLPP